MDKMERSEKIKNLRPGMEHLDFIVTILKLKEIRKVKTYSGIEYSILEGEVEDESDRIAFTVWNDKADLFKETKIGDRIKLLNCFISSYKGVLQINVGRDSDVLKVD